MKTITTIATLFASSLIASAAAPEAPSVTIVTSHKAIPIRSVAQFSAVFDSTMAYKLSTIGAGSTALRGTWIIIDKGVCTDFFDHTVLYVPNAVSTAPSPTIDEVAALRTAIRNRCIAAAATKEALSGVAEGQITADFFAGKIKANPAGQ